MASSETFLQFTPLTSAVDNQFWHKFEQKKLDVLKLSDAPQSITGYYTAPNRVDGPAYFNVPGNALDEPTLPPMAVPLRGAMINTNTAEEFQRMDKKALFNEAAQDIWNAIQSGEILEHPDTLSAFLLLSFADLKRYKFRYWFAFPAMLPSDPWRLHKDESIQDVFSADQIAALESSYKALNSSYFVCKWTASSVELGPLHAWTSFVEGDSAIPCLGFLDPSGTDHPGWPLRNLLAAVYVQHGARRVRVLCYRSLGKPGAANTSRLLEIELPPGGTYTGKAVGWEATRGKLVPKTLDLASFMDPQCLADTAVDLNLKLMRWRTMPHLDLDRIKHTKCLLLGAGTLGCYVARCLMGWGVRHISFVDNGRVSFSNPVRQPLYEFEDCLQGGAPKAEAAAQHLKRIQPSMTAKGYSLSIPMPGHAEPDDTLRKSLEQLTDLIKAHDVVFLLTDSRESRWLPTLLGNKFSKVVINAALGFDSYLVMRHGTPASGLGCYFCNDIVAPVDSLTDRTLDQQCTVTRPGLAPIAGALAVELMVSLLQHADGANASGQTESTSELGLVPHQIRGFLGQFNNLLIVGQSYDKCTACSSKVVEGYSADPFAFVQSVVANPLYLESVTGLDVMKHETDAWLETDWSSDVDDTDFT